MGDDGVGIRVVRTLRQRLHSRTDLDFKELSVGGLRLVEEMLGYKEAIIVDSVESSIEQVGQIQEFTPDKFKATEQPASPHVTNFATAFELYKKLEPGEIPDKVRIFTIGISPDFTFREGLSPPVQEAASRLVGAICQEIEQAGD